MYSICSSNCNIAFCFLYFIVLKSFSFPASQYFFAFLKAFCLLLPLIFRSLLNLIARYCPFLHLDLPRMSVTVCPEHFLHQRRKRTKNPHVYDITAFLKICVLKNLYSSCFYMKCHKVEKRQKIQIFFFLLKDVPAIETNS